MVLKDIQKKKLPDAPGIYFFLGQKKKILYIGKATSIRDRVRSYFFGDITRARGEHIVRMIEEAKGVDFKKTDSVLEALILEANLIRKHTPPYNSRDKDDKSFNYLVITKEEFPRVLIVRGKDLQLYTNEANEAKKLKAIFGPFPQASSFKEAVKIIRKIFPFYDTKEPITEIIRTERGKKKLIFNTQIGLYPGIPGEDISKREYARTIRHIKLFFEGKKGRVLKQLEREMKQYAKEEQFERAAEMKRKIFALKHIQDVALIKDEFRIPAYDGSPSTDGFRIEAYDIAHISGMSMVGVMVVVEDGVAKKSDYRKFKVRYIERADDVGALKEVLVRRLSHSEWTPPRVIVTDGGKAVINAAESVLKEFNMSIPVVSVVKDERHRPRNILGDKKLVSVHEKGILHANSEAHRFAVAYHRKLRKP